MTYQMGIYNVVYLQQYAKSYTCLIERTVVISLSSGRNLGTVQRYLSSCCTEVAPSLDHITLAIVYSRPLKVAVQSRYFSDGATRRPII